MIVAETLSDDRMLLEIVTPTGRVFSQPISALVMPGHDGYFGVLPHHTPLLAVLKVGDIKITQGENTLHFATSGGVVEVLPDRVKILAETAEDAATIDVSRAEAARERARARLAEGRKKWETARAEASLARATNRLRVVEFYKDSHRAQ